MARLIPRSLNPLRESLAAESYKRRYDDCQPWANASAIGKAEAYADADQLLTLVGPLVLGQLARLRAQNRAHAERRDREMAGLMSKVAQHEQSIANARARMERARVEWSKDHASQQPGGWWRYTSLNNVTEVLALVEELDAAKKGNDVEAVYQWAERLMACMPDSHEYGVARAGLAQEIDAYRGGQP